ncbi:MAG: DUF932 domain-containing protein [Armatimonas sp.]
MSLTLDEVSHRISWDDQGKHDHLVPVQELSLHEGRLYWPGADDDGFGFALTPYAMGQACQKLGMPAAYFARCPKSLQDDQFNHWRSVERKERQKAGGDGEERWTLRAKNSNIRGVLSARYEKLDNHQLLEALVPALSGSDYAVKLFDLTDESFHLRLIDPRMSRLVLPGDPILVAIHVANSEIGLRAVTIDACVFRQVCSNGLVRKVAGRSILKQRHIHVATENLIPSLQEAVQQAKLVAAAFLEQMILSAKTLVPDPERAIQILAQSWKLTRQTVEFIRFGLHGESRPDTVYGLLNAVTNAAQRLSPDNRFELETLASVLIDTNDSSPGGTALRRLITAPKREASLELALS